MGESQNVILYILLALIGGLFTVIAFFLRNFILKLEKLNPERFEKMSDQLDKVYEIVIKQQYVNQGHENDILKLKDDVSTLNKRFNYIERMLEALNSKLNIKNT